MIDFVRKNSYGLKDLEAIVTILRTPGGCPWDGEQTHESIRRDLLEECCEVIEAIDENSTDHLKEELGDLLLQVFMHAEMEKEQGRFTVDDVADNICKKLIYRHPHVFGEVAVAGTDEVLVNWEALKRKEKGQATTADAVESVPHTLPALWRAEKVQKKAAKAGFDWPDVTGALDKLEEEIRELREAVASGRETDAAHGVREELGDVLFMAAKVAQMSGVDPEEALHCACDKFNRRFRYVEEHAGEPLSACGGEKLIALWQDAKKTEES